MSEDSWSSMRSKVSLFKFCVSKLFRQYKTGNMKSAIPVHGDALTRIVENLSVARMTGNGMRTLNITSLRHGVATSLVQQAKSINVPISRIGEMSFKITLGQTIKSPTKLIYKICVRRVASDVMDKAASGADFARRL